LKETSTELPGSEHPTHFSATPGSNIGEQPGPSPDPNSPWQSSPNGTHSQQPIQQSQNNSAQAPPQPQYQQYQSQQPQQQQGQVQSQPQSQQYQQQSPDMYHNHQAVSASMNAPSMQTMEHHSVQGQQSHVPQAPIGSPMPPMASVGQYMTGYPNNVAQMGMNSNAQMRYQLPGDPNKMLSGGRHKKEVKRRTKTGCLTCRKRRIKVRDAKYKDQIEKDFAPFYGEGWVPGQHVGCCGVVGERKGGSCLWSLRLCRKLLQFGSRTETPPFRGVACCLPTVFLPATAAQSSCLDFFFDFFFVWNYLILFTAFTTRYIHADKLWYSATKAIPSAETASRVNVNV
jgi:hypothetical protein